MSNFVTIYIDNYFTLLYHIFIKRKGCIFMVSSDFRKEARENLSGKRSKPVCINLAYMLVIFLFNILEGFCSDSIQTFLSLPV